ncbi:DUF805 domain-containing protein [Rhizobium sp. NRK18]|uniref:DUF805 domain-containing protein n=1 Tax=Rhizobium sp. NRK18 TaxID=2964667 RepID=UPI0021C3BF27|nr:DUF805 domain-containing protein [Rhizobium sp. NRK18]MCQ2002363.1 DUF805 domain-containing protein [Rhizobium sp. NRK18]
MKNYANFSGRSTRSQYWLFTLFFFISIFLGAVLDEMAGTSLPDGGGPITGIIMLAHMLPALAVFVRRMHDIDRSGWWLLVGVVPLVGFIIQIVFLCTASTPGSNRFGPPVGSTPEVATAANATAPARQSASSADTVGQLEKLAALKASGAIDDAEYQKMKADVLGGAA